MTDRRYLSQTTRPFPIELLKLGYGPAGGIRRMTDCYSAGGLMA